MQRQDRAVTTRDVAREAGVSRSTVSYVLNNHPHQRISAATKERVLKAAERLGYRPSAAALSLRRGQSDLVVGLVPDFPMSATLGGFLRDLAVACARRGMSFATYPMLDRSDPLKGLWQTMMPRGVIALEALPARDRKVLRSRGIPAVEVVYSEHDRHRAAIRIPNHEFGVAQAELLYRRGHRRLAYAYPDDPAVQTFAEPRLAGVRKAASGAGMPEPIVVEVAMTSQSATWAINASLAVEATAICAYNDDMAIALLGAAWQSDIAVPEQLAVVGVDNVPAAEFQNPPLTTVWTNLTPYAETVVGTIACAVADGSLSIPTVPLDIQTVERSSA